MECNKKINDFFDKHIKLNKKRIETSDSICSPDMGTLPTFLSNNVEEIEGFAYQGSRSYHTLIKPHPDEDNGKYDIDLAVKIKYNEKREGNEKKYYDLIYNCLYETDRYKDKVTNEKERAVRVNYDRNDGEFYVDLVPMFKKDDQWYVVDSKINQKEVSGSFLFRDWVNEQNNKTSIEGSQEKFLKKVIQIYKFFRNESHISNVKSVQLTLLLSRQIDKIDSSKFSSISSSLYHISLSLKEELENCEGLSDLDLSNPCLSEERFDRCFKNEESFDEFKESILEHIGKIIDAYNEEDEENSLQLWQGVFGDGFEQENVNKYALPLFNHAQKPTEHGYTYHMKRRKINIKCKTKWKYSKSNKRLGYKITKHGKKILPGTELIFYTTNVPKDIKGKILWQVTNNARSKSLRGEIHGPSLDLGYKDGLSGFAIKEMAEYRGIHYVRCRLVNSQNIIIAESSEFYINVI